MGGVRKWRWRTFSYHSERGTLNLGPGGYTLVQQGGTAGQNRKTWLKVSRGGEKNEVSLWGLLHRALGGVSSEQPGAPHTHLQLHHNHRCFPAEAPGAENCVFVPEGTLLE